ncbi:MAG TPA: YceD family protein [Actinomycetes bacterium]|jgi:uncharacterized protein|nr:YceD family protein [Actinomycetes bacterium]
MSKQTAAPALAVNVRELLNQPGAHKHVVQRGPLPNMVTPVAWVEPDTPVTVDAEVESVVEGLLVTGQVSTWARLQCARCLSTIGEELRVDVRELFALDPREAEDEGYALLPDDRLPLDAMARDAIVLAFPAAPLCRPDCAGLCPQCGADLNVTACGHRQGTADLRWAGLAELDLGSLRSDESGKNRT